MIMHQIKGGLRAFVITSFLLGLSGFLLVRHNYLKIQSGAFQEAKRYVQDDAALIDQVGEIKGYGLWVSGDINDTEGTSNLDFKVEGSKGTVVVSVYLEKSIYGRWVVKQMNFK
jgi:hypothetical protein